MDKTKIEDELKKSTINLSKQHLAHYIRAIEDYILERKKEKESLCLYRIFLNSEDITNKNKAWGFLFKNGFEITISNNGGENTQRMLVAHELGHLILHHNLLDKEKINSNTNKFNDNIKAETEATYFAKLILEERGKFYKSVENLFKYPESNKLIKDMYDSQYDENLL